MVGALMVECARTGETFMTRSIMEKIKGAGYCDRVQTSEQTGSQFWMNTGYKGPEPPLAVKGLFSSADYARDWIAQYSRNIVDPAPSPAVQNIAQNYPEPSANTKTIWNIVPQVAPPAYAPPSGGGGGAARGAGGSFDWSSLVIPGALLLVAVLVLPGLFKKR